MKIKENPNSALVAVYKDSTCLLPQSNEAAFMSPITIVNESLNLDGGVFLALNIKKGLNPKI